MAITRAGARSAIRSLATGLPEDCWIAVIARLELPDICRAICASKAFALMAEDIWRAACELRWPAWTTLANVPGVAWRRQFELLSLREREEGTIPDVAITLRTQSLVRPYHRAVLTEWLAEVRSLVSWNLSRCCDHRRSDQLLSICDPPARPSSPQPRQVCDQVARWFGKDCLFLSPPLFARFFPGLKLQSSCSHVQVSWDWRLDTTVLHRAVSYLDHYIQKHDIQPLNKYVR